MAGGELKFVRDDDGAKVLEWTGFARRVRDRRQLSDHLWAGRA